jgi:hypothetical protein
MNWFSATPSSFASLRTSSTNDARRRSATFTDRRKMPLVERHEPIGSPVDRRFQYHVIVRIPQPGPPWERQANRFGD